MTRDTNIEQILFPVELTEIFQYLPKSGSQQTLLGFEDLQEKRLESVGGYKAVTNPQTGQVFSVVTDGYRLVTNAEALNLAKQCFQQLFDEVNLDHMEIFNVVTPGTRSFCHIDLIHMHYAVNIWAKEIWLPFLRVTNSYNRSRALSFDLGFCRALCENGMIFESETIKYRFYHTHNEISPAGNFRIDFSRLKSLEQSFQASVKRLNSIRLPRKAFLPLACKALDLTFDLKSVDVDKKIKEEMRFKEFKRQGQRLVEKYVNELGENAYAALSVITDIATRPFLFRAPGWMVDHLQKRAGRWFDEFVVEVQRTGFELDRYLGEVMIWFIPES